MILKLANKYTNTRSISAPDTPSYALQLTLTITGPLIMTTN